MTHRSLMPGCCRWRGWLTSIRYSCATPRISDAGLAHLEGLTKLRTLDLYNTRISDAGLRHLKGLMNIRYLNLDGTRITDAGLPHLKGLTSLKELRVFRTGVTEAGLAELLKALPSLTIQHSVKPGSRPSQPQKPGV